jgi:hypothetical protein
MTRGQDHQDSRDNDKDQNPGHGAPIATVTTAEKSVRSSKPSSGMRAP